jgi:hypothetical protein
MEMKKTLMFTFAILSLILCTVFASAVTGSMGNAKMVLYPEVNGWTNTVIEKTILINNVNDIPINITLRTDENASKFVDLIDENFILEPGETRKAQIEIHVKKVGTYTGSVNVFFKPIDSKEAGVVLSSQIVVIASKNTGYEEEKEPTNTSKENTEETITGNENTSGTGPSKLIKFWGISTFTLLVILLILLYIWGKKRNKSKRKRKYK